MVGVYKTVFARIREISKTLWEKKKEVSFFKKVFLEKLLEKSTVYVHLFSVIFEALEIIFKESEITKNSNLFLGGETITFLHRVL